MSRMFHYLIRSSVSRAIKYDCNNTAPCLSHLQIFGVSAKFCTKPEEENQKPKKKETKIIPKITLLQQNDIISITTLEEATKLARRRDLQLIKVQDLDPKSKRAVYRLATAAELLADDFEDSKKTKTSPSAKKTSVKSLTIGSRISDNDLNSRLKNVAKWLAKGSEIRILIQGTNDGKDSEKIFQKIEACVKEPEVIGKINQKRSKDGFIKFNIYPVVLSNKEAPTEKQKA